MRILEDCPASLGYSVRLARPDEIEAVQKLRYQYLTRDFDPSAPAEGIDFCAEDEYCDHLIAVKDDTNEIVGNYRLLSSQVVNTLGLPFICETEFDISNVKSLPEGVLEIGRAVVNPEHRNAPIIKLLWQGLISYCKQFKIRYIFGTASFHKIPYDKNNIKDFAYAESFSYLAQNKMCDAVECSALEPRVCFDDMVKAYPEPDLDRAKEHIPALIRTYLALGGTIGKDAYIDIKSPVPSIDVVVILDLENINKPIFKRLFGVEL